MRKAAFLAASRAAPVPAPVAPVVRARNAALEHRPVVVDALPRDGQAESVEVAEGREVGHGEGSVEQVEVFQMGGIGTPILGDLDPYSRPPTRERALQPHLRRAGKGFGLFIDEMQDLDTTSMSALIAAQHLAGQADLPFYIIGAGLPNVPRVLTEARSYAERLFDYRPIGAFPAANAARALVEPAVRYGADYSPEALEIIMAASGGYPYFIQAYGQAIWNLAPAKIFTADDAHAAVQYGLEHLDASFFRARWERATPAERRFLAAMAVDHDNPSQTAEVARRLEVRTQSLGPSRAGLMAKGLVYSPEHGQIAYTVPGMASYVNRNRASA